MPPTTPLCWGKIFLFNVEHLSAGVFEGIFPYNFLSLSRHLFKQKSFSLLVGSQNATDNGPLMSSSPRTLSSPGPGSRSRWQWSLSTSRARAEPDIRDYNLTIRCRWITAIMRIKTDILGRYFEEPGAGIKDLSRFIPRLARLNNV